MYCTALSDVIKIKKHVSFTFIFVCSISIILYITTHHGLGYICLSYFFLNFV